MRVKVLQFALTVCAVCRNAWVKAEDRWSPPPPGGGRGRGHQMQQQGGGGLWTFLAATAVSTGIFKFIFSNRKTKKLEKKMHMERENWAQTYKKVRDETVLKYDTKINQWHYQLVQAANTIEQLEQVLYKLPDVNNDNVISRTEFRDYMDKYKRMHPEIRDNDLPRFEDMDHDRSGQIHFEEWEQYQIAAMNGQL